MKTTFIPLVRCSSFVILSGLSLAACGGSGGSGRTFEALSEIQGTYRSSDVLCEGTEELNADFETEVMDQASDSTDTFQITKSQLIGSFPHDDFNCIAVATSEITAATNTDISYKKPGLRFQGSECDRVPTEDKRIFQELINQSTDGSMKIRSTSKILMTIEDESCDVYVRIK